jgi:hypothetical protein
MFGNLIGAGGNIANKLKQIAPKVIGQVGQKANVPMTKQFIPNFGGGNFAPKMKSPVPIGNGPMAGGGVVGPQMGSFSGITPDIQKLLQILMMQGQF